MIAPAKSLLTLCILSAASTIFGCNGTSLSEVADKAFQDDEDACRQSELPFKHTICQISQQQLTAQDSHYTLKLFWRASDAIEDESSGDQSTSNNEPFQSNPNTSSQLTSASQSPLYKFDALINALPADTKLKFAANAGMYNNDFAPIGYTVIKGEEVRALNLKDGGGNFHLLPNGVLWWNRAGEVFINESHDLQNMLDSGTAQPWYATQSGPMLVIKGDIHPKFDPDSNSRKFRNGVGVCTDGQVKFVNSDEPVTFYQFGALFKEALNCPNALFLDGGIASALYAPEVDQKDDKNMGVMVGVVEKDSK